jgi:CRISPR-associated protein Cas1
MKHLSFVNQGSFLGVTGERLSVYENGKTILEFPFSRIKTIRVSHSGITLSSNLLIELSQRGIQLFLLDFRGQIVSSLSGSHQHAVTQVRKKQFEFINSPKLHELSTQVIIGKMKNQRAVLKYFQKYFNKLNNEKAIILQISEEKIQKNIQSLSPLAHSSRPDLLNEILGYEGSTAAIYWNAIKEAKLLPNTFENRTGRNSDEITNQSLNYGYAILSTYIWNSIINSGLEPYSGFIHTDRPGKPSLVLDLMEEYRPWCVDRIIIKIRTILEKESTINSMIKSLIIKEIHETFSQKYPYKGKKLRLESILQRQVYRISAYFFGKKQYRPYIFKW